MENIPSFYSERKFYGDSHYPYGIDRSGEFTREQVDLLLQHGWAYQALAEGSRAPGTEEEEAFVAVCRGEQAAKTVHERVWVLFCGKTSAPKMMIGSPLAGSKPPIGLSSEEHLDDDIKSSTL
jgi:uncharacterized protein YifE (UPF0438 family)